MIVIGLTGSIGMGKTTAANMLREMGIPVHDSDQAVHDMLESGGAAVAAVAALFPDTYDAQHNRIDRKKLGPVVFDDREKRRQLESVIHPLVQQSQDVFLLQHARNRAKIVVLDIPLLFEVGAENRVDCTMVVFAPEHIQRQRVMARDGMTEEAFARRKAAQMPDAEKRKRADFIIENGLGLDETRRQIKQAVDQIGLNGGKYAGCRFPAHDC